MSAPIAPPVKPIIDLCGRISATALWLAGPRVEARVSSPRLAITRLALTETPEPELEPSEAERRGSYTLAGLPPQVLRWWPSVDASTLAGLWRPAGPPARPVYSRPSPFAQMIAPFF